LSDINNCNELIIAEHFNAIFAQYNVSRVYSYIVTSCNF